MWLFQDPACATAIRTQRARSLDDQSTTLPIIRPSPSKIFKSSFARLSACKAGPGSVPDHPESGWYGVSLTPFAQLSRSSDQSHSCPSAQRKIGGSGSVTASLADCGGQIINPWSEGGTHCDGDGARRWRFPLGCEFLFPNGVVGGVMCALRLGTRVGAAAAMAAGVTWSEVASPAGAGAGAGAGGVVWSRMGSDGAMLYMFMMAQRLTCRFRLEFTPNRRPQLSHLKA